MHQFFQSLYFLVRFYHSNFIPQGFMTSFFSLYMISYMLFHHLLLHPQDHVLPTLFLEYGMYVILGHVLFWMTLSLGVMSLKGEKKTAFIYFALVLNGQYVYYVFSNTSPTLGRSTKTVFPTIVFNLYISVHGGCYINRRETGFRKNN